MSTDVQTWMEENSADRYRLTVSIVPFDKRVWVEPETIDPGVLDGRVLPKLFGHPFVHVHCADDELPGQTKLDLWVSARRIQRLKWSPELYGQLSKLAGKDLRFILSKKAELSKSRNKGEVFDLRSGAKL